ERLHDWMGCAMAASRCSRHGCTGLGLLPLPGGERVGVRGQVSLDRIVPPLTRRATRADLSPLGRGGASGAVVPKRRRRRVGNDGQATFEWRGVLAQRPHKRAPHPRGLEQRLDDVVLFRSRAAAKARRGLPIRDRRFGATHHFSGAPEIFSCADRGASVRYAGSSMTLTWPTTICQPLGPLTQVCVWRPILPGARRNSVEATAKSRPKVVITVRFSVRARPAGERAARNALISAYP